MDAESTHVVVEPDWSERMAQLCHRAAVQVSTDLANLINNGRDTIIPTHMLQWLEAYLQVLDEGGVIDDPNERLKCATMQNLVARILQLRSDTASQANAELQSIMGRVN